MKGRLIIAATVVIMMCMPAGAQTKYGIFDHLGGDFNVGTLGVGFDIAAPLTPYLEVSAGLTVMPGIKISDDVDVNDINFTYLGNVYNIRMGEVNITGNYGRTTGVVKISAYPFGARNALFVTAGASFGGSNIFKLNGHSDDVKAFMDNAAYPDNVKEHVCAEIGNYEVKFDRKGDVKGDIRVNSFRPYFALGYGRIVPKHRLGFRAELGMQVHGKMKIYQNNRKVNIDDLRDGNDDFFTEFIDKLTVYPVLKLSLSGRIL